MQRHWVVVRHHSTRWFRSLLGVVGRFELKVLIAAGLVIAAVWAFIAIAGEVVEGDTKHFDERIMQALRRADDPATPLGPEWLQLGARDITSFGNSMILGLITAVVAGFILLHKRHLGLVLVLLSSGGAGILNAVLKHFFARDRPTIVPHLMKVSSKSFPSGHAMAAAAIYLSLAVLLASILRRRRDRAYVLGVAIILTILIGLSRVYLGVHYPTDVLAGWSAGVAWAMLCWLIIRFTPRLLHRSAPATRSDV
jgi:undecaprenyl-diphosphatase